MSVPDNTLMDSFGRSHQYLRISVTDRCNFRCRYCMPQNGMTFLPRTELLNDEEILRLASLFVTMGIHKIRLTGGEPMTRQNILSLIERLAGLDGLQTLAMTTNGYSLSTQTKAMKAAGLQGLNISLDSLRAERFRAITGTDGLPRVLAGIESAMAVGFESLKLNMVVMAGVNDDEIPDFLTYIQDKPINLRFIEYMPFSGNQWSQAGLVPYADMRKQVEARYTLQPLASEPSAVAKDFGLAGYRGTVSFISSMTEHFCGTCNRLRLTADGQLKACLFQAAEINLRDPLREGASDEALRKLIRRAVWGKQQGHAPIDTLAGLENRPMIAIGG